LMMLGREGIASSHLTSLRTCSNVCDAGGDLSLVPVLSSGRQER
jgi:hypothetical protein